MHPESNVTSGHLCAHQKLSELALTLIKSKSECTQQFAQFLKSECTHSIAHQILSALNLRSNSTIMEILVPFKLNCFKAVPSMKPELSLKLA